MDGKSMGTSLGAAVPATERIAGTGIPQTVPKSTKEEKNVGSTTKTPTKTLTKTDEKKQTNLKQQKNAKKDLKKDAQANKKTYTPKGKAKGDDRRIGGKWPGAIGVSIEPKLFQRLEKGRAALAKRQNVSNISRSKAISMALDLWLSKVGA